MNDFENRLNGNYAHQKDFENLKDQDKYVLYHWLSTKYFDSN